MFLCTGEQHGHSLSSLRHLPQPVLVLVRTGSMGSDRGREGGRAEGKYAVGSKTRQLRWPPWRTWESLISISQLLSKAEGRVEMGWQFCLTKKSARNPIPASTRMKFDWSALPIYRGNHWSNNQTKKSPRAGLQFFSCLLLHLMGRRGWSDRDFVSYVTRWALQVYWKLSSQVAIADLTWIVKRICSSRVDQSRNAVISEGYQKAGERWLLLPDSGLLSRSEIVRPKVTNGNGALEGSTTA
ncbi:hypothetical protein BX600DRAFT_142034 [Xylariales sp. PMI_506]|nr:hypothetical protein BX600DRAFT_142034 [Xylariales sp. PMI_506]